MFNKLMFFILVFGSTSAFSSTSTEQCFNLFQKGMFNYSIETSLDCSPRTGEKNLLVKLTFMKQVDFLSGSEYKVSIPAISSFTNKILDPADDSFASHLSVIEGVYAFFNTNKKSDDSDQNADKPKEKDDDKNKDDLSDNNKFNNHNLLENYTNLETAEAAYKNFKASNASNNFDISEVTTTDSDGVTLVVSSDYKNSTGTDYINSAELENLNKMNKDMASQKSILDDYASKTVFIGNGGRRKQVDLLIKDGDNYKINPEVKNRKISNDGTDETRQANDRKELSGAKEALTSFNQLRLDQSKLSQSIVAKAKESKESDLKVAYQGASTLEDNSRDAFKSDLDALIVCKKARYQAQCLKKTSEVEKQCAEGAKGSDKDICKCDVTEEGSKLVPEKGETCDQFSDRVAQTVDEEVLEQKQYYASTIDEEDKTIDENIDYEGGTSSVQELISENAKELDLSYCDRLVSGKNLISNDDQTGFSFSILGSSNQPLNDKPHAFEDPLQCTSSKSDKGSFDYKKMYGFYTDRDEDYLSHLTQSGKSKLCAGIAYTENAVAKTILESSLYSNVLPPEGSRTCNDILSVGRMVCTPAGTQNSLVLSQEAYRELFIKNQNLSHEQQTTLLQSGVNGFPDLKTSFISNSSDTDKYASKETCYRDIHEKFKQCMGMKYEKVSHLAKKSDEDPNLNNKGIDSNAIAERKANIGKEVYRQFGVCHAFKEIAKKVASDSDEWSGQETVSSLDGQYNCIKTTPFSLDFKACKRIVNTYNGFMVGDQARGIVNQGVTMAKTSNIRRDATSQMASGDQLNAGLDAQKKTYEMQRDQERGNLAFFGVQAATFTAMLTSYPTPNKISKKCGGDTEIDSGNFCKAVLVWNNNQEIRDGEVFPNQETKKKMWMEVMKAASSATLAAIKQGQLNKMAGDIKKIKDAFNGLADKSTTKDSQIELSYCKFNPTAPTCRTNGPRVTREGGFQYGSITSQNAGGGAFNISGNDEAFGEYDEDEDSAAKRAAIQDLGGMIDNTSADSFDNQFDKIGVGSFAKKGLGGGGGSGGGASGGGGGGGGGAAKGKAGGQDNFAVSKSGGAGSFQSGSGGKAGFGTGGSSSKKNSSKNPFSNMFGSKKGRSVASQGNNDIAPANSALFDKISKRYGKIAAENRLINLQGLSK